MRLDWMDDLPDLWQGTYNLVAQVPEGRVTTYGAVAKALGDVVASRFVGLAMSKNEDIVRVPCRRVVQSDGFVGGYTLGGPRKKARLLRAEGVNVRGGIVTDIGKALFDDFETTYPLKKVRAVQTRLKKHLVVKRYERRIIAVEGIDVAYEGEHGFAAKVSVDPLTREIKETEIVEGEARFPYVPTYLSFREIPIIEPLLRHVEPGTVIMYDGNGILHPLGFGIASHLGVSFDAPTVGIAKKLLCGEISGEQVNGARPVKYGGRIVGHALGKTDGSKPIFVSAGHKVSKDQSLAVAQRFLKFGVPEPVRLAHIAAKSARRGKNNK